MLSLLPSGRSVQADATPPEWFICEQCGHVLLPGAHQAHPFLFVTIGPESVCQAAQCVRGNLWALFSS